MSPVPVAVQPPGNLWHDVGHRLHRVTAGQPERFVGWSEMNNEYVCCIDLLLIGLIIVKS